jgi:nucleoside-diphosphate-sugar epimerase
MSASSCTINFVMHRLGSDSIDDLAAALAGVDCVFSILTPPLLKATQQDFYRTNVQGVDILVAACQKAGVPRLVHLSSIAVTHHMIPCSNMSESDPLPAWATYNSPYDVTKRLGEQAVVAANDVGNLKTCSIRAGSILIDWDDYIFSGARGFVPGVMFCPASAEAIDFIDCSDLSRALLLAAQALAEKPEGVAGETFFVTKGDTGNEIDTRQLMEFLAGRLGWKVVIVPDFVQNIAVRAAFIAHKLKRALGCRVQGVPYHLFYTYHRYHKTFDNSKVRRTLGFKGRFSPWDSITRVVAEHQQRQRTIKRRVLLGGFSLRCLEGFFSQYRSQRAVTPLP